MWIVLQRELRELARQNGPFGLRLLGGGIMTLLLWLAWERGAPGPGTSGRGIFLGLNRLLFLGIWLVGPVLTADCLSREKREGTLGLLFLTPLRPLEVVVGKAFSQAARAFLFVLAAVPVLVVPVLIGGVTWMDTVRLLFLQFAALGLALSAGLAASSLTTQWWRARLLAVAFAAGTGAVFVTLHLSSQVLPLRNTAMPLMDQYRVAALGLLSRSGLGWNAGFDRFWQDGAGLRTSWAAVGFAAAVWGASWLLVAIVVRLAAAGVRRTWRMEPPSTRRLAAEHALLEVRFGRPRWLRNRNRVLERNPIRWLQSRSWDTRVAAWLLVGAALAGWWLATGRADFLPPSRIMFLRPALLGFMAFAATASFRAERESGALELWLVTPLTPATILRGRLGALVARFSGAFLVLVALPYFPLLSHWAAQWLNGTALSQVRPDWLWHRASIDLHFALWMVTTALLGIALSLSRLSQLSAFGLAWVMHHTPDVLTVAVDWLLRISTQRRGLASVLSDSDGFSSRSSLVIAGIVLLASWRFGLRQLAQRHFLPGIGSPRLPPADNPGEVRPS